MSLRTFLADGIKGELSAVKNDILNYVKARWNNPGYYEYDVSGTRSAHENPISKPMGCKDSKPSILPEGERTLRKRMASSAQWKPIYRKYLHISCTLQPIEQANGVDTFPPRFVNHHYTRQVHNG